ASTVCLESCHIPARNARPGRKAFQGSITARAGNGPQSPDKPITNLARGSTGAPVHFPVDQQANADPGTDGDRDGMLRALQGSLPDFAPQERVHVVLHIHRAAQLSPEVCTERDNASVTLSLRAARLVAVRQAILRLAPTPAGIVARGILVMRLPVSGIVDDT